MPCCTISHIEYLLSLIQIRRQVQIKLILINSLQFISCVMIYSLNYKTISPYISTVLALLSIITLGWLSWCQERHIEQLGRSIVQLCLQTPSNNPTENDEDGLHQN